MAKPKMTLHEHLHNLGLDGDFLRQGVELLTGLLMELEAAELVGADRYERSGERQTQRNGHRHRRWETRVGEIDLAIPKLRKGSYYPSFLDPRRPSEKALLAVVQTAYVKGVSTRKVDALLKSLGLTGIDKSKVSRICKALDEQVEVFQGRPLEDEYPYVWLDGLYVKVRENHRIVSKALIIAIGVRSSGERDVLGFSLGASEEKAFWMEFLRSLKRRGLSGVKLVISDNHEGLKAAQAEVLAGASWQRCRVHFMRNVLAHVPKDKKQLVAAALRTIFAQTSMKAAQDQMTEVISSLQQHWPKAATVVEKADTDVLAYLDFPPAHWTRIYSNNPLERLNREIKRRVNVVGVFPDAPSVDRLVGTLLMEIDDEWQSGRRHFGPESMAQLYDPEPILAGAPQPLRLAPIR